MGECPHCGGTNGYEGVLVMRYRMTGAWGQEWEVTGDESAQRHAFVVCVDCGKRVRRLKAMSIEDGGDDQ